MFCVLLLSCIGKTPTGAIRDVARLPQDFTAYYNAHDAHTPLFEQNTQKSMAQDYLKKHFSPWHQSLPYEPQENVFWGFVHYKTKTIWGENLLPRESGWLEHLEQLADRENYPNCCKPAITIQHTSMRVLPTQQPIFANPTKAGQGFPFDHNQNSLLWAGTPVFVLHVSTDRAWLLCKSRFASGWIPAKDIAYVDADFIQEFSSKPHMALIHEHTPIIDQDNIFRFHGRLGMLLPSRAKEQVLLPVKDIHGMAQLKRATCAHNAATTFPLPLNKANIAKLGNALLGQEYGWGGLFLHRDCSATLMDLFTPFGIALPRNSQAQAMYGTMTDVSALSRQEKKDLLLSMPELLTLVGKKGHSMLYVGQYQGEPLIFHALWGLHTQSSSSPDPRRKIIGSTVISTLEPGKELPNLAPQEIFIDSIRTITRLNVH